MSQDDESPGFLNRWSARKQAAEKEGVSGAAVKTASIPEPLPALEVSASLPESDRLTESENLAAASTSHGKGTSGGMAADLLSEADSSIEVLLSDADMPAIETLTADSELSAFFNKGVSAALRKAALRHVFQQPRFNVRDGLNDYDGDFTSFEPLGDTVTADMKFHRARKEKARLEAQRLASEQSEAEHVDAQAQTLEADVETELVETELVETEPAVAQVGSSDQAPSREVAVVAPVGQGDEADVEAEARINTDHGLGLPSGDEQGSRNQDQDSTAG